MTELDPHRSLVIGRCSFPQREDYLAAAGIDGPGLIDPGTLPPEDVGSIQRDWHSRGQNGCVFAVRAAKTLSDIQWSQEVNYELPEPDSITSSVEEAVNNPDNQLHSLVFPNVTDTRAILELVGAAVEAGCIIKQDTAGDASITRLRWLLSDEVESLVLGFAPVKEIPLTRRAPFTELLFKTKPKTETIMHDNLDHRRDRTHAADLDPNLMGLNGEQVGSLIAKSEARTARVLEGETARPDISSAKARTTFGLIPSER